MRAILRRYDAGAGIRGFEVIEHAPGAAYPPAFVEMDAKLLSLVPYEMRDAFVLEESEPFLRAARSCWS